MDLQQTIKLLLKKSYLRESYIEKILQTQYVEMFSIAFTHSSLDERNNYELFEFLGDTVVNNVVSNYIHERFPHIRSVKWLTRIKHNLISTKTLSLLSERIGFPNLIRIGTDERIYLRDHDPNKTAYRSLLEDIFESFIGCLVEISDNVFPRGTGYSAAYSVISGLLNEMDIPTSYEEVFDAKSRLKEMYDKQKWNFGTLFKVFETPQGTAKPKIEVVVYSFFNLRKEELLRATFETTKSQAEQEASRLAIIKLGSLGIKEDIPSPSEVGTKRRRMILPEELEEKINTKKGNK